MKRKTKETKMRPKHPSLNNCRHHVIQATCTKCWPKGNILVPKSKERK